ncbi:type II toxin-antitoxin system RelE/ParE family toxin [Balneolaceae bacterium ANBcel3]|nr:type II toxin-antitoxin system RelE/ParE family toxin [Balneolaceae bacterium ANBcel3]
MRQIIFYKTQSGKSPVADFLDSLNAKQAKKVTWVLHLIENSKRVPQEYFKKLSGTSDIWEVRVQSGSNIFRLLGFVDNGRFVVLTNGFQKKSQKTPKTKSRLLNNGNLIFY